MSKPEPVEMTDTLDHQEVAEQSNQDTNLTESATAADADVNEEAQQDAQVQSDEEGASEQQSETAAEQDADTDDNQKAQSTDEQSEESQDAEEQSESAAEGASNEGEEVAKSAVFGNWAEIGMVTNTISNLSWTLQDHVWMTLSDDDKSAADKKAGVDAALSDFHALVMKVVDALVQDGNAEEVKRAADAFKANQPETLTKTLSDKDAKVEELTKSLSAKEEELTTVRKSLEEAENEVEKMKARKSLVFDKFAGAAEEIQKSEDEAKAQEEGNKLFANFVITGAK